ncbi:uncharacterized protein C8A04DRAFT_15253 [Dichotomopilus funicola]|uniref:Diphthine methyltransferase n=1 Tax=Dichotomopilus funicola TaxID=1934379 RepID=A0AAN6UW22_9PEZI|nr:hypothetical protein C8A04DRAFT_15253 [Dichotomopilus funicola]
MESEGKLVQSRVSLILDLPPSCVEFCPAFPSYFLVGTYSLQADSPGTENEDSGKQPQSRSGSIVVFQLTDGNLNCIQTVAQPSALLDLRFSPHDGQRDICAVVSSTATVALFQVLPDQSQALKHLRTMDITTMSHGEIRPASGEEILFTSFGWHPSRQGIMAVTTSTGHVYLLRLLTFDGPWELDPNPVIAHSLEAWCTVISQAPTVPTKEETDEFSFRVYSGGDDSMLRSQTSAWDGEGFTQPLPASEWRGHDAGVTAILPLFMQEDGHELVVTGSYDEHIRLLQVPPFGRPKNLAESRLGGGVWRLNLIELDTSPNESYVWRARILASCMHAGARVVELVKLPGSQECGFNVLTRFEEHKSMNYGSDFHRDGVKEKLTIVSTSFYDKLLCLWEAEM